MNVRNLGLLLAAWVATFAVSAAPSAAASVWVYVGTYTNGASEGLYLFEMDPESGKLSPKGLVAKLRNPSFLAIHPEGTHLYAVNEVGRYQGEPTGAVSAFKIEADGRLEPLNRQPSKGGGPCHIVVDRTGKNVLVANYGGGNVTVIPIARDGSLGTPSDVEQHEGSSVDPRRQQGPHAHSINLDKANRFAVAADLGLDKVLIYRFDAEAGSLEPNDPPAAELEPGSGPRHFAFDPENRHAYVINELASTITVMEYDTETGALSPKQTITTLPKGFDGTNHTADIHVSPAGRFVYGSNRGHDSLAVYAVEIDTGRLKPIGHVSTGGETPRNFNIEPSGRFLLAANQDTDTIAVFRIDPDSGIPEPTGHQVRVPTPVCVQFLVRSE